MGDRRISENYVFSGLLRLDENGHPVQASLSGVPLHGTNAEAEIYLYRSRTQSGIPQAEQLASCTKGHHMLWLFPEELKCLK